MHVRRDGMRVGPMTSLWPCCQRTQMQLTFVNGACLTLSSTVRGSCGASSRCCICRLQRTFEERWALGARLVLVSNLSPGKGQRRRWCRQGALKNTYSNTDDPVAMWSFNQQVVQGFTRTPRQLVKCVHTACCSCYSAVLALAGCAPNDVHCLHSCLWSDDQCVVSLDGRKYHEPHVPIMWHADAT